MNKFRYVRHDSNGKRELINIEHISRIDEEKQMIGMVSGEWMTIKYADIWQLVEDLKSLEVGDKS